MSGADLFTNVLNVPVSLSKGVTAVIMIKPTLKALLNGYFAVILLGYWE